MNPVHEHDGLWYFWNEIWTDEYGPFESKSLAEEACRRYAESL